MTTNETQEHAPVKNTEQSMSPYLTTPSTYPTTPPIKKKTFPFLTIALVFIILLDISIAAFFFIQNQSLKSQLNQLASQEKTAEHTPASEITTDSTVPSDWKTYANTEDWKTYTNTKNQYTIKYPPDWQVQQTYEDRAFFNREPQDYTNEPLYQRTGDVEIRLYWYNDPPIFPTTIEEVISDDSWKTLFTNESKTQNNLIIDGHKAVQLSGYFGPGILEGNYWKVTYIQLNNQVLEINLGYLQQFNEQANNIYTQILSSLKFTD